MTGSTASDGAADGRNGGSRGVLLQAMIGSLLFAVAAAISGCARGGRTGDGDGDVVRMYRAEARDLGSPDKNRKYDAYARFYELGEKGIPTLLEALESPDPEVRVRAARILIDFGEESGVPVLLAGLGSPREEIREVAIQGLLVRGLRSLDEVTERLGDPDPRIRRGCLEVLRKAEVYGTLPAIVPFLEDEDRDVRWEAVLAAGSLMVPGSIPPTFVDRLIDPDPEIRDLARRVLVARGGYPGDIPPTDDLDRMRETVDAIREWLAVERQIHSLDR